MVYRSFDKFILRDRSIQANTKTKDDAKETCIISSQLNVSV